MISVLNHVFLTFQLKKKLRDRSRFNNLTYRFDDVKIMLKKNVKKYISLFFNF